MVRETLGTAHVLAQDMLTHMPNLTKITLGPSSRYSIDMQDREVAALLSGSRKGWRILKVCYTTEVGAMAVAALLKHSPTLESLVIEHLAGWLGSGALCLCQPSHMRHPYALRAPR